MQGAPARAATIALTVMILAAPSIAAGDSQDEPRIEIETPHVALRGLSTTVVLRVGPDVPPGSELSWFATSDEGDRPELGSTASVGEDGTATVTLELPTAATWTVVVRFAGQDVAASASLRAIPGWWTLVPAIVAIVLALALRQVVPALLSGVWIGAWIGYGGPLTGILRTVDTYVVDALSDPDHVAILVFSLLLGGMVGIISRSGGTVGLVEALASGATSRRHGQLTTWFLGIAIFFDDYANTLVVGNSMRPVTDRLKISREKLAYIVDSTAAPVAAIALITTWIGAEVSYIGDALADVGSDLDAYVVFLQSIPYNFYPLLALVFGFSIAFSRRDFGPMLRAERRALGGEVLRAGAQPLSDFDNEALEAVRGKPHRWFNAAIPVVTVIVVTLTGQWVTGRAALAAAGEAAASAGVLDLGLRGLGTVFSAGDSYRALMWAAFAGCVIALGLARTQRILTLEQGLTAWAQGMKSMVLAFVILTLAWSIGDVCGDLSTANFIADVLRGVLDPRLLPALVFIVAAGIAFATGTSWGTMGLLIPLAVPASFELTRSAALGPEAAHAVFLGSAAAVLSGAIFGDHCSPISDTTVLSSMASGCDHVDHVRTQLPYALTVGAVVIVLGYLPEAVGVSPWICLLAGGATLVAIVRFVGRPVESA